MSTLKLKMQATDLWKIMTICEDRWRGLGWFLLSIYCCYCHCFILTVASYLFLLSFYILSHRHPLRHPGSIVWLRDLGVSFSIRLFVGILRAPYFGPLTTSLLVDQDFWIRRASCWGLFSAWLSVCGRTAGKREDGGMGWTGLIPSSGLWALHYLYSILWVYFSV